MIECESVSGLPWMADSLLLHPDPIHLQPCTFKLHAATSGPRLKEAGPKGCVLLALLRAQDVEDGAARPLQVVTEADHALGADERGDGEEDAVGTSVDDILDLKIEDPSPRPKRRLLLKEGHETPVEGISMLLGEGVGCRHLEQERLPVGESIHPCSGEAPRLGGLRGRGSRRLRLRRRRSG